MWLPSPIQWKLDYNVLPWTWRMLPVSGSNRTMLAPKASSITAGRGAVPETGESWATGWVWCHGRKAQSCQKKGEVVLGPLTPLPVPKPNGLHALILHWVFYLLNLSPFPLGMFWFSSVLIMSPGTTATAYILIHLQFIPYAADRVTFVKSDFAWPSLFKYVLQLFTIYQIHQNVAFSSLSKTNKRIFRWG